VTVRIAILGTRNVASIHAEALLQPGDSAELVAAADVDEARLAEFARRHDVGKTFGDLSRMLSEAKRTWCTSARRPGCTTSRHWPACAPASVAGTYASALGGGRTVTPADVAPGTPFYERMSG
jgi:hypothetical protein